jgi:dolichol-phosphate mannosyltransferase
MNVCILIPTLNEESTIGDIIGGFQSQGFTNILVMDGNSTDRTVEIAREKGARVEIQRGKGKGLAVRQAFELIEDDVDVIVIIDGDGTYRPSDVGKLLDPIRNDEADHVIGNRFADYEGGAFTRLNLFGDKALNRLFGLGYGIRFEDMLSGYRALKREVVKEMNLNKSGFEIEAEMTVESVKKDIRTEEAPISYRRRIKTETKLHPLRDGARIGYTLYDLVKTYNPILYFGLFGILFILIGIISGAYVVSDWLSGISRVPLTIFTALMIITGFLMFTFGLLGDLLVTLQKELIREIRRR